MAVVMRLRRMGGNQRPYYRLVATDSRNPREGRFLEHLGDYNPMVQKDKVRLKADRIVHWLQMGAVPSVRVKQLLRDNKICLKKQPARAAKPAEDLKAGKKGKKE